MPRFRNEKGEEAEFTWEEINKFRDLMEDSSTINIPKEIPKKYWTLVE